MPPPPFGGPPSTVSIMVLFTGGALFAAGEAGPVPPTHAVSRPTINADPMAEIRNIGDVFINAAAPGQPRKAPAPAGRRVRRRPGDGPSARRSTPAWPHAPSGASLDDRAPRCPPRRQG